MHRRHHPGYCRRGLDQKTSDRRPGALVRIMKVYPVYLNGELTVTEDSFPVTNPATGEIFARMSRVGRPEVARAVQDAHTAFSTWRHIPGKNRGELLNNIANELFRRREEIARLITLENGKPLTQSQG